MATLELVLQSFKNKSGKDYAHLSVNYLPEQNSVLFKGGQQNPNSQNKEPIVFSM